MGLAILCPGQGAQNAAMFDLLATQPRAREVLDRAGATAGYDLIALTKSGADIFRNTIAQPLICVAEVATWAALQPLLPPPGLFAGYSVGELAAYGCAGALSVSALTRLAAERAALMDGACNVATGLIALRNLSEREVTLLCERHDLAIAIVNGADHFIVGGPLAHIAALEADATSRRAQITTLPVNVAAHTRWLAPAQDGLRAALRAAAPVAPTVPVLAGASARAVVNVEDAIDALTQQLCTPVRWSACLDEIVARQCRVLLELGPGTALAHMARERFPDLAARSVAEFRSVEGVAQWVEKNL